MSTSTARPDPVPSALPGGQTLYHFPLLDSTNAFALKLLSQTTPKEGTIVSASYQTAGRGQPGNHWFSSPGKNLCASWIFFPRLPPPDQFVLNMAVSLAVHDTLRQYLDPEIVSVKWPNDLFVGNRKIGGILIQNTIQGSVISSTVAGIGLNINETAFPRNLPNPTSIALHLSERPGSTTCTPEDVRSSLHHALGNRMAQMHAGHDVLTADYHEVLFRRNMPSLFRLSNGAENSGRILGVDEHGRLMIRWEDGRTVSYQHREVELILS